MTKLKILFCHNFYQQPGGEDQSFREEMDLMTSHGHEAIVYTRHNDTIRGQNPLAVGLGAIWNQSAYREVERVIRAERPDVMHCTNTFPLISPAVYYAAKRHGVPVVQALRNYRLSCASGLLHRNNAACEACLGKQIAWPALVHSCYQDSRLKTLPVVAMQTLHRWFGTWQNAITAYYTLTEFARKKAIAAGVPADRLFLKPNFARQDLGVRDQTSDEFVFVGRLSREKGIDVLLDAWKRLDSGVKLAIVGDGPEAPLVEQAVRERPNIRWLGRRPHAETMDVLSRAKATVIPSTCYEVFARVVVESFSLGVPVLCSDLGTLPEVAAVGDSGRTFPPGDAAALAELVRNVAADPEQHRVMRAAARREYEQKYSSQRNYELLLNIYHRAIQISRSSGAAIAKSDQDPNAALPNHEERHSQTLAQIEPFGAGR